MATESGSSGNGRTFWERHNHLKPPVDRHMRLRDALGQLEQDGHNGDCAIVKVARANDLDQCNCGYQRAISGLQRMIRFGVESAIGYQVIDMLRGELARADVQALLVAGWQPWERSVAVSNGAGRGIYLYQAFVLRGE